MEWKFSEEQQAYAEALGDWLDGKAPLSQVRTWFEAGSESEFEEEFAEDWAGVGIDGANGGQGGGLIELALTAQSLAKAGVPSTVWLATILGIPLLGERFDLVGSSLNGAPLVLAARADAIPSEASALYVDAQGRITGSVPQVLAGAEAAGFIVLTGEPGEPRLRLVQRGDEVNVTERRLLDLSRKVADVEFVQAPSVALDVDGVQALRTVNLHAAILSAADALGASERMLSLSVEYSKQRTQFGVPIGSFQAVKHAAATMMVATEAARSVIYYAAAAVVEDHPEAELYAAATKAQVTSEAVKSADSALTVHGAIGYTWEHDLHLFYKRAKLDQQLFGSPRRWNDKLADALNLVNEQERHLV